MIFKKKQPTKRFKAAVVGAGSIGAMKPDRYDSPKTKNILTMAHAFHKHPQVDLVGIVDIDGARSAAAARKWDTTGYVYYDDILREHGEIDLLAVCIPTEKHYEFFRSLRRGSAKMILAEKPFCSSYDEAQSAALFLDALNLPVAVNYTRRYLPAFQILRDDIEKGLSGKVLSCVVYYDRGTVRDGSHAIDLFRFLFGKFMGGSVLPGRRCADYSDEDITLPIHLVYERCENCFMIPADGTQHSIFEVDIITSKGRCRFIDNGKVMETYPVKPEGTYGDYKVLSPLPEIRYKTELETGLIRYVQHCIDYLEYREPVLICPADEAVTMWETLHFLNASYHYNVKETIGNEPCN